MGNAKLKEDNDTFLDELSPGTELLQGQYKIAEFLNSGGFGITYLATDSLQRKVVIKECFPSAFCNRSRQIVQARSRAHSSELRSIVSLFVQEARSLAKLKHPNIVGVHQVFEENDTAYMVLDFVEGRDLLDTLEEGNHKLTAPQIKGILKDVLDAVQFIHNQDILHRDISPDNILLDSDLRPVLIDFGAAREEATKKSRVLSAMRVVKDGYSPQEFYVQGSEQTPSSDLYALGATFYHLVSGEIPPNSQARLAAIAAGEEDPYRPLAGEIRGFDNRFLSAIDAALGILPKDRLQSAEEWLDMMEGGRRRTRNVTTQAPKSSAAIEVAASERSSKLVPLMGSVAVLAILAVGGLAYTGKLGGSDENVEVAAAPTPAADEADEAVADIISADAAATVDAIVVPQDSPSAPLPFDVAEVLAEDDAAAETGLEDDALVLADALSAAPEEALVLGEADAGADTGALDLGDAPVVAEAEAISVLTEMAAQPETVEVGETDFSPLEIAAVTPAPTPAVDLSAFDVTAEPLPTLDGQDAANRLAVLDQIKTDPVDDTPSVIAEAANPAEVLLALTTTTLPFEGKAGTNVIDQPGIVAPIWVETGARITAVNGTEISDFSQIDAIVAERASATGEGVVTLDFTVLSADGAVTAEHAWGVPVIHETALPDGTIFRTTMVEDAWVTKVAAVNGAPGELQVGDTVVAYVPTTETIDSHDVLRTVLERELAQGIEQLNFAVTRDGAMWVVSMSYVEGA